MRLAWHRLMLKLGVRDETTHCAHGYAFPSTRCYDCNAATVKRKILALEWDSYNRDYERLRAKNWTVVKQHGPYAYVMRSPAGVEVQLLLPNEVIRVIGPISYGGRPVGVA